MYISMTSLSLAFLPSMFLNCGTYHVLTLLLLLLLFGIVHLLNKLKSKNSSKYLMLFIHNFYFLFLICTAGSFLPVVNVKRFGGRCDSCVLYLIGELQILTPFHPKLCSRYPSFLQLNKPRCADLFSFVGRLLIQKDCSVVE